MVGRKAVICDECGVNRATVWVYLSESTIPEKNPPMMQFCSGCSGIFFEKKFQQFKELKGDVWKPSEKPKKPPRPQPWKHHAKRGADGRFKKEQLDSVAPIGP